MEYWELRNGGHEAAPGRLITRDAQRLHLTVVAVVVVVVVIVVAIVAGVIAVVLAVVVGVVVVGMLRPTRNAAEISGVRVWSMP